MVKQIITAYHLLLLEKSIPKMKPIPKLIRIGNQFKLFIFIDLFKCIVPKSLSHATIKKTIAIKQSVFVIFITIFLEFIIYFVLN